VEFNLAQVFTTVAATVPDRECIVTPTSRATYAHTIGRAGRLSNALRERGLGKVQPRQWLAGHESGQDHLALYLHNCPEYLEGMLGSFMARVVPFNVNYRYVAEELEYLLNDAQARAIVVHSAFAPTLAEVRDRLPQLEVILQIPDSSGNELLEGAEWFDEVLNATSPFITDKVVASWSPDDLYMLYTGGTTGMPKGVLWRQADIFVAAMGGRRLDNSEEWASPEELMENAQNGGTRLMPAPPFMHGAAHWMAFNAFTNGHTLVLPGVTDRFDADDVLTSIEEEQVNVLLIVGDAFGRPLVQAIEQGDHDVSSLLAVVSGGAPLSVGVKDRLLASRPPGGLILLDGLGSSETGQQASQVAASGQDSSTGSFAPGPGMCILNEDLTEVLDAGHESMGWLGQSGRIPLGYLGDEAKTAATFPVVDEVRYSVPGDRARLTADGTLELLGRDSVTINSGGEKIFAEEVEAALLHHPAVVDCLVAGRPSERWGKEVVAVVQLAADATVSDDDLVATAAEHIARYKLPKAVVRVTEIQRSPSGKADYRWAAAVASEDSPE